MGYRQGQSLARSSMFIGLFTAILGILASIGFTAIMWYLVYPNVFQNMQPIMVYGVPLSGFVIFIIILVIFYLMVAGMVSFVKTNSKYEVRMF